MSEPLHNYIPVFQLQSRIQAQYDRDKDEDFGGFELEVDCRAVMTQSTQMGECLSSECATLADAWLSLAVAS